MVVLLAMTLTRYHFFINEINTLNFTYVGPVLSTGVPLKFNPKKKNVWV